MNRWRKTSKCSSTQRRNKYNARKTEVEGIVFDSKKEAELYLSLKSREQAGEITNLCIQRSFELIPAQKEKVEVQLKTKVKYVERTIERNCCYLSDFCYEENGKLVVVDCKSPMTRKLPVYKIKKKLMLYVHNIKVKEM